MATRSTRVVVTLGMLCVLTPFRLTAQVQHDMVPLKPWPAPLYWQPSAAEDLDHRASSGISAESRLVSSTGDVTTQATTPGGALVFVAMTPCRLVDTRAGMGFTGAFGPPGLVGGQTRTFPIQSSTTCSIPSVAQAYSFNVTVVPSGATFPGSVNPSGALGYLTIWPTGTAQPNVSTLNSFLGTVVANAAIVPAGVNGSVDVFVSNGTDLIIDINGYYAPPNGITLAQGAATAPSMSFSGDPGTGIYSSGAGTLNIATAGTTRVNVDSGGNVGIGTTTPAGQLHVRGTSPVRILGDTTTLSGTEYVDFFARSSLFTSDLGGMRIQRQNTGNIETSFWTAASGNPATETMRLSGTGNVGVATTSPFGRLHVVTANDANPASIFAWDSRHFVTGASGSSGGIGMSYDQTNRVGYIEALVPNVAWGNLVLQSGGGHVGIGTSTPTQGQLQVEGGSGKAVVGNSVNSIGVYGTSNASEGVYGTSNGYAGVYGTSSTGYGTVGNSVSSYGVVGTSETSYAGFFGGNVYVTGTVTQNSDARLKQDISTLSYGLPEVMHLRPVTWTWKQKPERGIQLGFVAQEVETVVPQLVSTAKDEEQTKGINYIGLVPVAIKAIQEQQMQIEDQRRNMADEQERIDEQQKRITEQVQQLEQARHQIGELKQIVCLDHPSAAVCQ